ncbi:Inner membrane ABC transporter permease protein YjfF [Agrobacterium fabrum]|uniref:ABC transporter permease n=1 Tax=Agrobacterium fabrum TaxID=1176649 RepID=UPI001DED2A60|nr:ABC transporter permease [Agrobacterium fabrum]CAH0144004.1 Inner membrane ABC transporter permease protein YjfF [Agrobacterium fabrum]CAH0191273.1 Inner membrane ABC transporter permease protein YjfF [Agrobacterium fabrum]
MNELLSALSRYRVTIILGATLVIAALTVPGFVSLTTASLGLDRGASIGIVAIGLTVLLIAGQIDLSVGAVFALSGIVAISLQAELGIWPAAALGVLTGVAAGVFNGFLTVVLKINALVATLASMLIFRSLAHWVTGSQPVSGTDITFAVTLSQVYAEIFTARSALFLAGIVMLDFWLRRTVSGRNLFAVGSNPVAAEASGISSGRTLFLGFVFAGALSGLAGVFESLTTNTGSPVFGAEITVVIIAAVVVGGTRLEGGRGSALGTLGGVLTIAALTTAMEFQSVPAYVQQIVNGLILILLVVLDRTVRASPRPAMPILKSL